MKSWLLRSTAVISASCLFFAACGGDVSESDDSADGQDDVTTNDDSETTGGGNNNTGGEEGTCGVGAVNAEDACELCIASQCTTEALACCEQEGCLDVVRCAADSGCNGYDCYAPDMCQAEIDAAGIEVATTYAQALGDCAIEKCEVECEDKTP